ncbi:MAG: hypothetical protein CMC76_01555 [Flavobacteriaceae bacterium]|nr:hypothetical protein [Flavobacteriaceae bacterium]|tara:strand:+ start:1533 stop:2540 length:1008 start_codon:yes stop_codon:yes gene_type:complete
MTLQLSIIIPVYNSEEYINTCIQSILKQGLSPKEYEIIIVNDGSTDSSEKLIEKYSKRFENIKALHKENEGVGSARNKGLEVANGNYIYFIDPDDYLVGNVLGQLVETAKNNDLDILTFESKSTKSTFEDSTFSKKLYLRKKHNGLDYIANHKVKNEVWWYLIKKDFLLKTNIKFIEGRWMEDAIFTIQLFLKASKIAHLPFKIHRHYLSKNSAMTNRNSSHYIKVIDDNRNAAVVFESIINDVENQSSNFRTIERLKVKQQSFVFFMMIRMLKSKMKLSEIKKVIQDLSNTSAYPLDKFPGKDYEGLQYVILAKFLSNQHMFYMTFRLLNPFIR